MLSYSYEVGKHSCLVMEGPIDGYFVNEDMRMTVLILSKQHRQKITQFYKIVLLNCWIDLHWMKTISVNYSVKVDNDYDPAPENVPEPGRVSTYCAYAPSWGNYGVCNRKSLGRIILLPRLNFTLHLYPP